MSGDISGTPQNSSDLPEGASDHDLDASLVSLSGLVMGAGQRGLEELLQRVAEFAVQAIPGADGAGLTLLQADRRDTMVASADFVRDVDAIQYGLGEGPCITAATEVRTVCSGSLSEETMWPRFGPQAADLGVHSALSLPLRHGETSIGAMNIYAHARDAFDEWSIELGEHYAVPAATSVYNAQILAQAQRVAGELQAALTNRTIIDQSLGILMSRTGYSADRAFEHLQQLAQTEGRSPALAAQQIVDDAVRRALEQRHR
jgi:transcriptional regulator with GAF, ATPase, and Fis domain